MIPTIKICFGLAGVLFLTIMAYGQWPTQLAKPAHTFEGGQIVPLWCVLAMALCLLAYYALRERHGKRR